MRTLLNLVIKLYLWPLSLSNRLALFVKGLILRYDEAFAISIDVIKRNFKNEEGIIADIGAYDGDSARYFAKYLPDVKIQGFEPNPTAYNQGLKLVQNYKNIELFNFGFADHKGVVPFYITKNLVSSSIFDLKDSSETSFEKVINVEVTTLDDFFRDEKKILLLKLDVQGAELKILQGGVLTLAKTNSVLTEVQVSDMYKEGCFYHQLDEFLRNYGFVIHTIITNYNNEGTKYFDILYIKPRFLHYT